MGVAAWYRPDWKFDWTGRGTGRGDRKVPAMCDIGVGVASKTSWLNVEGRGSADGRFSTSVSWTGIGRETIAPIIGGISRYGCEKGYVLWRRWQRLIRICGDINLSGSSATCGAGRSATWRGYGGL